jgi:hypothetical protein
MRLLLSILGLIKTQKESMPFGVKNYYKSTLAIDLKKSYYENVSKNRCLCGGIIKKIKFNLPSIKIKRIYCNKCKYIYEEFYDYVKLIKGAKNG